MITDGDLRELFRQRVEEMDMDIDRALPETLLRRVRRRQGLVALASAVAVAAVVVGIWMGTGSALRSDAIPPADDEGVAEEIDVDIDGRSPTVEALKGIWLNDGGPTPGDARLLVRFDRDGTVAFDNGGYLDSTPAVLATYEVRRRTISFRTQDGDACREGDDWAWRAGVPDAGKLHIVFIEDGTGNCSLGLGTEWTFTRVSPASPASEQISTADLALATSFDHRSGNLRGSPPSRYSVFGIYLLEGTGRLMKFTAQETYSTDDVGELGVDPQDQGSIENDGRGTLRFISGAESRRCVEGAVTVWKRVRVNNRLLQTVVARDDCGGKVGDELTWIRLAP